MLDQYGTGVAMNIALEHHKQRRDLLMFSALPDAPVLPIDPPSRSRRVLQRLSTVARTLRRRSRTGDVAGCYRAATGSPAVCRAGEQVAQPSAVTAAPG